MDKLVQYDLVHMVMLLRALFCVTIFLLHRRLVTGCRVVMCPVALALLRLVLFTLALFPLFLFPLALFPLALFPLDSLVGVCAGVI